MNNSRAPASSTAVLVRTTRASVVSAINPCYETPCLTTIVEQSPLDWTIVRAAVLKDDPTTGHYTATNTDPTNRINRAHIATALVDQLDDTTYSRTAISVTN